MHDTVAFIGGGNMTRAIALGLVQNGHDAGRILISEPSAERRRTLEGELGDAAIVADNRDAAALAGTLVLAVKPQVLEAVCRELADTVQRHRPLVVSIAAGVKCNSIDTWLGGSLAVVRVMPNQPALVGLGVSGLFGNAAASEQQLRTAEEIMTAAGRVVHVQSEEEIDAVTAISGSGPAYFFLLIDMLATTGRNLGLDAETAKVLALETAQGSAALALDSGEPMAELIARVRSPGGTTAAALDSLDRSEVRGIFERALTAARDRAAELADSVERT